MTDVETDKLGQPTKLESMVPKLDFVFQSRVTFKPTITLGNLGGMGVRMMIGIQGGDFEGPSMRGRILPGGAEWPLVRPDGVGLVDARYTLETDDGVLINIRNTGYRHGPPETMARLNARKETVDPEEYYLRTYTVFEAPVGRYDWLSRHVFIGIAERQPEVLFVRYYVLR
jgi:hypothetical protein